MKILVFEPHGDDALLSCNSLLETDNEIDIVTFGESRSSEGLKEYYPSVNKVSYLKLEEIAPERPLLNTYKVHRDFLEGKPIAREYDDILSLEYGERYSRVREKISNSLESLELSSYDLLSCCAGISHPYHVALRDTIRRSSSIEDIPILWYGDKPYLNNRYSKEFYETLPDLLGTDKEINIGYDHENKNVKIEEVMGKVYPSECKLFRFYGKIILNCKCKYLYNSRDEEVIGKIERYL